MLAEEIPHQGGRPKLLDGQRVFLADLGISEFQSHRWQLEALALRHPAAGRMRLSVRLVGFLLSRRRCLFSPLKE